MTDFVRLQRANIQAAQIIKKAGPAGWGLAPSEYADLVNALEESAVVFGEIAKRQAERLAAEQVVSGW